MEAPLDRSNLVREIEKIGRHYLTPSSMSPDLHTTDFLCLREIVGEFRRALLVQRWEMTIEDCDEVYSLLRNCSWFPDLLRRFQSLTLMEARLSEGERMAHAEARLAEFLPVAFWESRIVSDTGDSLPRASLKAAAGLLMAKNPEAYEEREKRKRETRITQIKSEGCPASLAEMIHMRFSEQVHMNRQQLTDPQKQWALISTCFQWTANGEEAGQAGKSKRDIRAAIYRDFFLPLREVFQALVGATTGAKAEDVFEFYFERWFQSRAGQRNVSPSEL